jgi:hypothetical protein
MNASIVEHDSKVTTLINVFTVQPNDQQRLVDLLIEATEKVTSQQEGFISAKIQRSGWHSSCRLCTMEKQGCI